MNDADDMNDNDIIGVIKIKDGLFICDELGAQVSFAVHRQTGLFQISSGPRQTKNSYVIKEVLVKNSNSMKL